MTPYNRIFQLGYKSKFNSTRAFSEQSRNESTYPRKKKDLPDVFMKLSVTFTKLSCF